MRILFADKFPETHIARLRADGHDIVYQPALGTDDLGAALEGVDVLVVRSTRVPAEVVEAAPDLSLILRAGAGVNTIAVDAAARRGVVVANTPGKNSIAVAELTMGLILAIDRNIPDNVADIRQGVWNKAQWSQTSGLAGRKIGIVGFGSIGQAVATRAKAFDMTIVIVDRPGRDVEARRVVDDVEPIVVGSVEELASVSDIVTVHVPSTEGTRGLIGRELLGAMRPGAVIINTSRSDVLDEEALLEVIDEKGLRVGIDVFVAEPAAGSGEVDSAVVKHPRVYVTHHIGASTAQAQNAVADEVVDLIGGFVRGDIRSAVNLMDEPVGSAVLTVRHADRVGALAAILEELRAAGLNVEHMENRIFAGAEAASATIEVSGTPGPDVMAALAEIPEVIAVRVGALGGPRPLVRPIDAYVPEPDLARSIVAPAVSSITVERFESLVRDNENSILHVLRGAIANAEGGVDAGDADRHGAQRLEYMIAEGSLRHHDRPAFFVYRITSEGRSYLSVIGDLLLAGLDNRAVRPHEETREETETLVLHHLEVVHAHTDPVAVTYRADEQLNEILDEVVAGEPLLDFLSHDGTRQQLWPADDPDKVAAIAARLAAAGPLYVTDGHHRIAASARYAADHGAVGRSDVAAAAEYIPTVFMANDQTDLFGYHRGVIDLGEHTAASFLDALRADLVVEELTVDWHDEARPRRPGVVGMRLGESWYRIAFPEDLVPVDPFEGLDAVLLQKHILEPLLGISMPRTDPRIRYIPGPAGLAALAADDLAVGFALYPPTIDEVMRVADLGMSMPPKSTWFEPKVKAGLIVRRFS
jgi:D-3-phosphoglycerate dehydrogenase